MLSSNNPRTKLGYDTTLNEFLETLVVLEPGEQYFTYSRVCHTHLDPQELAARLCIPGQGFVLNAEGAP